MNRVTCLRASGFLALALAVSACADSLPPSAQSQVEVEAWQDRAERVEILRDEWGVPHIYAPTDADAVFGLMYAQAEDDFNRIEVNFLTSLGRMAEAEGEDYLWQDLRQRLFIDPAELQATYAESPAWLQALMDGWADGLNYFLHRNPEVTPKVLTRFEPWMALSFSEGSIGGDIERVRLSDLSEFYASAPQGAQPAAAGDERDAHDVVQSPRLQVASVVGSSRFAGLDLVTRQRELQSQRRGVAERRGTVAEDDVPPTRRGQPWASGLDELDPQPWASGLTQPDPYLEPVGSNGIAIAPENTVDGNALLLINPHTSFFFRHEAHVVSDEGLNAYGALTWGQFFVYQGFNETAGWMHTSSEVDNIDEFAETVVETADGWAYEYGDETRPLETDEVTIRVRTDDGGFEERNFTTWRSHHGPIARRTEDGRWIATALMEEPMRALIQSYSRTKASNLDEYLEVMQSHTNSSNNTLFADAEGNIAYLHSNFVPIRDAPLDYDRPVDGSDPGTDWQGIHSIDESPNAINPSTGFAYCTNNWPWSAAGTASPRAEDYPRYMDRGSENPRGIHALELLPGRTDFTLDGLVEAAYDTRLPLFDDLIPALVADLGALDSAGDARAAALDPAVRALEGWNRRWSVESTETSLAIFWVTELRRVVDSDAGLAAPDHSEERFAALEAAIARLEADFGTWQTPWGEINRFQRVNGDILQPFNDDLPSTPVGFPSARWGSLASFGAAPRNGTRRWYGTSGNSFVAVVEFGERLRARAVTAGGLNHDPASLHFNDQAERYATGNLRDVHFYRDDVEAHSERRYRPGQRE